MRSIAAAVALLAATMASLPSLAQQGPFPVTQAAPQPATAQAQLDQLLAPIALFPDELLGNVLAASTYPFEVVSLKRWLDRNPGLAGDALAQALAAQPWDESVKALAPFGSVVAMMSGELEWTQRLGNAFLSSEADVMDTVQSLRRKAREAGNLPDSARERVVDDSGMVFIEPAEPDVIYVPFYDPRVVYGPWWWPDYPPYVWGGSYFGSWDFVVGGTAFGYGVHVGRDWRDHRAHPDWRGHNLLLRRPGRDDVAWRHDPGHRGGVPYPDSRTRDRFGGVDRDRVRQREDFRGFDVRGRTPSQPGAQPANPAGRQLSGAARATPQFARPEPGRASPLSPVPRDFARQSSERGRQSLAPRAQPANPASRSQPSSAASSRPAPSQGASRPAPSGISREKR